MSTKNKFLPALQNPIDDVVILDKPSSPTAELIENITDDVKPKPIRQRKYSSDAERREAYSKSKYSSKYYHAHNTKIKCNICGVEITKNGLAKHQQSLKCKIYHLLGKSARPIG